MGAWIEINSELQQLNKLGVAPRVGAWIEILDIGIIDDPIKGRAPRGRVD